MRCWILSPHRRAKVRLKLAIYLIHLLGPYGLTDSRTLELFSVVQDRFRVELGVELKLVGYETKEESDYGILSDAAGVIEAFKERNSKLLSGKENRCARLYIGPPTFVGSAYYLGGAASGICRPRGKAYALAEEANPLTGEGRWYQSEVALGHELGHISGARHEAGTIMDPDAIELSKHSTLSFSARARRMVRRCLGAS